MTLESFPPDVLRSIQLRRFQQRILLRSHREGTHRSNQKGFGTEFSEYRAYEPGDNPKHIDWNHFAKSDKLYVKVFHEEKNLSVLLVVDGSNSMRFPHNPRKWNYVKNLSLALAGIGFLSSETVSLSLSASPPLLNLSKLSSLNRLSQLFEDVPEQVGKSLYEPAFAALQRAKLPSQAIIISDFLEDLSEITKAIDLFHFKNVELTGIQVLDDVDINPLGTNEIQQVIDYETGELATFRMDEKTKEKYLLLLESHKKSLKNLFFSRKSNFISVLTSQDLVTFINSTLTRTGLLV
jgi:uncharacterized protein (DUF58 family)